MELEWNKPAATEIEVSIFGKGVGESILVHVGDGKWLVVDSLRVDKVPVPLVYLERLGVDVASDVALIVASHWHDDHIHGLAETYEKASAAKISFPEALLDDEFRTFASMFRSTPIGKVTSGVEEFGKILQLLQARDWRNFDYARAWTTLLRYQPGDLSHGMMLEVEAISPSSFDMKEFLRYLATADPNSASASAAPHYDRNDVSCALHIRFGDNSLILGADLENVADDRSGWKAVFASQQMPPRSATLIKIPHHGSITGHHDLIWDRFCNPEPVATLTPWARGLGRLPKRRDVDRILAIAGPSYASSRTITSGSRHALQAVNSTMKLTTSTIRNVDSRLGHVRHRLDLSHASPAWVTELFGQACQMNQVAAL